MLEIKDLHVAVDGKEILKGLSLSVAAGEVHAVMGPNGSGKSTLVLCAGRPRRATRSRKARSCSQGEDLAALSPEARAAKGMFLAFQYPLEIPGVPTLTFLKTALNAQRRARGEGELDAAQVLRLVREKAKALGIAEDMLKRALNVGFSGGEKKRNEMLQMALLEPKLAILDETDSGLDIDAMKLVAEGVNALRAPARAFLVITHYQRLLEEIVPDHVHVLAKGRIVRSGDASLARELEAQGYEAVIEKAA